MFKVLRIHKVHHKILVILAIIVIAVGIVYALNRTKGAVSCETTSVVLTKASGSYTMPSGDSLNWDGAALKAASADGVLSSDNVAFSSSIAADAITKEGIKTIYYVNQKSGKDETLVNVSFNPSSYDLSFDIVLNSQASVSLSPEKTGSTTLSDGSNLIFDGGKLYSTSGTIEVNSAPVEGISLDSLRLMIEKRETFDLINKTSKVETKITPSSYNAETKELVLSYEIACEIVPEEEPVCEDTVESVNLDSKTAAYVLPDGSDMSFDGGKLYSKTATFTFEGKTAEYISLDDLKMLIEKKLSFSATGITSKEKTEMSASAYDPKTGVLTLAVSIVCDGGTGEEEEEPDRCTDDSLAKEEIELSTGNPTYLLGNNIEINFNGKLLYAKNANFVSDVMSGPKLEMDIDILQSVLDKNTVIKVVNLDTRDYTSMNVVDVNPPEGTVSLLICGTEKYEGKITGGKIGTVTGSVAGAGAATGAIGQSTTTAPVQSNVNNSVVNNPTVSSGGGAAIPARIEKPAADCDAYLTDYIKFGRKNDVENVKKLQRFLKQYEGFTDIVIDGFYGKTSFAAVETFQKKYLADVLNPWGISDSTGYVFKTTTKKINELYCLYTSKISTNLN
jgi:cellobiose-specific phosphotransferase system component IIB